MDVHLESTALALEMETGVRHQRFRFDGRDVRFAAGGQTVHPGQWVLGLDHDEHENLLAVTLDLENVDSQDLALIDKAVTLPAAARSPKGAAAVRLHLLTSVLDHVVKPAMPAISSLPDLLQLRDHDGLPVFFDLANFTLTDLTPHAS